MKRLMQICLLVSLTVLFAHADLVYDRTTETGFRFNPGGSGVIAQDDVPIPVARLGGMPQLNVTKVTIGIRVIGGL